MEEPDKIILPKTHPSMYLMHKYWARKPFNVVSEYIKKYTSEDEIVLDPFCGSGVTIAESLLVKRKAIGIDLNPFAILLTKNTITKVDLNLLYEAYAKIEAKVEPLLRSFYGIECPICGNHEAYITHIIWKQIEKNDIKNYIIDEIRILCKVCGIKNNIIQKENYEDFYDVENKRVTKINLDFENLQKNYNLKIPIKKFRYSNNLKFRQLRHDLINTPHLNLLFTKRNLLVLGIIKKAILDLDSQEFKLPIMKNELEKIKNTLMLTFSANIGQSSKMVWVISKRKNKKLEKREVGSWTHHFFWNPSEYFEINPWKGFKTRFNKTIRAKKDFLKRVHKITKSEYNLKIFNKIEKNINLNLFNAILINNTSENIPINDESVDYIFTDPPYGDSIQYFELSSLWNSWLELNSDRFEQDEIIINKHQKKHLEEYSNSIYNVFKECYRILKNNRYMTVTFHNTDLKVRNALILSIIKAGFILEGLLFQMPPRNSLKSYLHYNKTPVGDYFIKFKKELSKKYYKKIITKHELKNFIKDRIEQILDLRGEPTRLILMFNFLDEDLLKCKLFPLEKPDWIDEIIEELLKEKYFKINKNSLIWFFDRDIIPNDEKNLSNRIKCYLKESKSEFICNNDKDIKLKKSTYSEIYNHIYSKFHGKLTPDRKNVSKIIEEIIK